MRTRLYTAAGLVALALLLGACGVTNRFSGSNGNAQGSANAKPVSGQPNTAASARPTPNWDEIRARMAEGLVPDHKNVRHSSESIPRQSEELDPVAGGTAVKPR